jgi:exopolyphosphatase/guanosine-5'-triphosphate,3'-diphosphate pyrophosphatase
VLAAIDAGSNTLRLLIGRVINGWVEPEFYQRHICRMAGDFSKVRSLSLESKGRALIALKDFAETCRQFGVGQVKAIGTAVFRQATNGLKFAQEIKNVTHLPFEIISW